MKTILFTVLFLISYEASSQIWCNQGANWKYSYTNHSGIEGYTQIQYVGDTIINGQPSKILDKHIYAYDFVLSQPVDFDLGQEYIYEENGTVFLWYINDWDTLYNLNASVGESWRMAKQPMANACDSNSILTVTATGIKTINSTALNYVVVDFEFPFGYSDTIVEKIGFIQYYFLPYDSCQGEIDVNEGGPFRCYEDNNFPTYKPFYSGNCDFIVGTDEIGQELNFQIVPNPSSNKIELIGISDEVVFIIDLQGKEWSFKQHDNTIEVSELPSGVYVLTVQHEHGVIHKRFIKL